MKKKFSKVYLEISNLCNLSCRFCPGTQRAGKRMTREEFSALLPKLRPWTDYLYFHLMGEPLCHPQLGEFLAMAADAGFRVILTSNGTLLQRQQELLLSSPALHKVNISLHAFEANDLLVSFEEYLNGCFAFGKAAEGKVLTVFRLWNEGGENEKNGQILSALKEYFPEPWTRERRGTRIGQRVYLESGEKFDWPDTSAADQGGEVFCHGLGDQIGVLCDGTVVPCCLDHEGDIALGNLFRQDLEEILDGPRALAMIQGFRNRKATEELCRKCGYARRF